VVAVSVSTHTTGVQEPRLKSNHFRRLAMMPLQTEALAHLYQDERAIQAAEYRLAKAARALEPTQQRRDRGRERT